ncbi:hypothetical protein [Ketobacter sp.]
MVVWKSVIAGKYFRTWEAVGLQVSARNFVLALTDAHGVTQSIF